MVNTEKGEETARVHVNKLRAFSKDIRESQSATAGVFPDSKRIIRSVIAERNSNGQIEFEVHLSFSPGYQWIKATDLPTVVVMEFDEWKKTK